MRLVVPVPGTTKWRYYEIVKKERRLMIIDDLDSFDDDYPEGAIPVYMKGKGETGYRATLPCYVETVDDPIPTINATFNDFVQNELPEWEKDLIKNVTEIAGGPPLYDYMMKAGSLIAVSDGGSKEGHGSFGWTIGDGYGVQFLEAHGIARGEPMSSFRAEAYGRLSIMRFLIRYAEFFAIKSHVDFRMETHSDSKSVLDREEALTKALFYPSSSYLAPDQDVMRALEAARNELPMNIKTEHVKGHQDDTTELYDLPIPALYNVKADAMATYALDYQLDTRIEPAPMIPLPQGGVYLVHNGVHRTSHERGLLNRKWAASKLRTYRMERHNWTSEKSHASVDWQGYELAMKRTDRNLQTFVVKFNHNWLPVNRRLHRQGDLDTPTCTLCGHENEEYTHLFRCQQQGVWRGEFIKALDLFLCKQGTAADIRTSITQNLKIWFEGEAKIESYQDETGTWHDFLKGYINQRWGLGSTENGREC
jgi:hypothetical protein